MRRLSLLTVALLSSCYHSSDSTAGGSPPAGPPPALTGPALFQDLDLDGEASAGDQILLRFNAAVALHTSDPSLFVLPVSDDDFGAGATLAAGPAPDQVTIVLGSGARLRSRGRFDPAGQGVGLPSGIDLAPSPPANALEDANSGVDAQGGAPVDLWPQPVAGIQSGLGTSAVHVTAGDLDRDGLADIVAATGSQGVDLYISLPGGGFSTLNLPLGTTQACLLADLYGRGWPDLVVQTPLALVLYENTTQAGGGLALVAGASLPLPQPLDALTAIDFDSDGDQDLLGAAADGLWLFENQGGGSFVVPSAPLAGSPAGGRALAVGDIDHNGVDDLLVALPGQNILLRREACGAEVLVAQGSGDSRAVALGDLNRDGLLDAVSAGSGPIEIWLGAQGGIFVPFADLPDEEVFDLALIDLDGDAILDLLLSGPQGTRILPGEGTGSFTDDQAPFVTEECLSIAAGDVDRDGDLDLALAAGGRPELWSASLSGSWGDPRLRESPLDLGEGPLFSSTLGDLDQDGLGDLILGKDRRIDILGGADGAQFSLTESIDIPEARAIDVALGDVDGDGDLDLAAALLGRGAGLWLHQGALWTAVEREPSGTLLRETAVELVDLTGDGFPELVIGTVDGTADRIYYNRGRSCPQVGGGAGSWLGFEAGQDLPGNDHTPDIAPIDYDQDGDLDLVFAHTANVPDTLFENQAGLLVPTATPFDSRSTVSLSAGDINADGATDIVSGSPNGSVIYLGDGSGQFTLAGVVDDIATSSTALVPLDGDAYPELLLGHESFHGWQILRGTPGAPFNEGTWQRDTVLSIRSVTSGDLDRDGAPDFFTGSSRSGVPHRVWLSR